MTWHSATDSGGLLDGMMWTKLDGREPPFELDSKIRFEDIVDSIGSYIDRYPEQLTSPTALIVAFALTEHFPNRGHPGTLPAAKDWPAKRW